MILQNKLFMDEDLKTWLYDILESIDENESYFEGKPKIFADYVSDIRTKRAVERDLEIIGEAVNRILKKDKNFKLSHSQKIIGTRNRIALIEYYNRKKLKPFATLPMKADRW